MADNLEFGVSLRLDVAQIARATSQMAAQFATVLNTNQQVAQSFDRVGDKASRAYTEAENAAQQFNRASRAGGNLAEELANDLEAVTRTARATRATLESVGADPQLFAVAERELQRVLQLQTRFNAEFERISRDPNLLRGYVQEFEQIRTPLSKSVSGLNELLRSTARERGQIQARETLQLRSELQERLGVQKAANSQFVVEGQRETTLRNAEIRTQGQLALQAERRTARTRIEILRFTLNQVRTFERAIGAVARGTAVIVAGAYARIEGAVGRLGRVFRRSNRSIDDGLQGALTSRERSIRSSFQRQTNDVRVSVNQQSAQLDRLERKLSTGVFGAASGRSRLGGALGIGGIIGGGAGIRSLLTAGFERFTNLERITNQLERLTGSAEQGAALMAEIDAFARKTPLALDTVAQLGVGFLTMGVAASEVVPNVNAIADAVGFTAGGAEQLERISLALRQIASTGKLQGDEFNQLAENLPGLDINQLLADQLTGGDTAALVKLRESGKLTADTFLEAFITGLQEDPRVAGSMNEMAETLQGQVNNLRASWARLGATIIGEAEGPIRAGIAGLRRVFSDLARFIEGDVGGPLRTLRQALIGIGGALGLLLAAKVAAESIFLLGTALRFALTPMGLLVVLVASVGAALRVFSTSGQGFADTLGSMVDAARAVAGGALALLTRGLLLLGQVIRTDLFPVLQPLIDVVGSALFRALEVSIGFIVLVAIPAFVQLGNAIGENFLPAVSAVGGVLQRTVVPALTAFAGAALSVLSTVVEFLQPAIDGFLRLGDSIVAAFADRDFGGLLGGLQAVAVGIGNVFRDLGVLLYNAIRPQVERAVGFIVETFQGLDLAAIGLKILEIVRLVGFILGSIVSDPRFLAAIAAIAGAAALLVGSFVLGVAEGIKSNLPELGGILRDGFVAALKEAVSDKTRLAAIIGAGLAAVFAARFLTSIWDRAGKAGATGMARGFATGIRSAPGGFINAINGLFGGAGGINDAIIRSARLSAEGYQKQFAQTMRRFNALGVTPTINPIAEGRPIDQRANAALSRELDSVVAKIGPTQARFREFSVRAVEGISGISSGFSQLARVAIPGVSGSLTRAQGGFSRFGTVVRDSLAAQKRNLQAAGISSGQAVGGAVLAGFGAVIAGQQLGAGNATIGLAGIFASALTAGLSTQSPAVAGAVAGIGLLTAVFERNKRQAQEAQAAIDLYTDAIVRAGSAAAAQGDLAKIISDAIGELDFDDQELLAGFDISNFVNDITDGTDTSIAAFRRLAEAVGVPAEAAARLAEKFGDVDLSQLETLEGQPFTASLQRELDDAGISFEKFIDLFGVFTQEGSNLADGIEGARLELARMEGIELNDPTSIAAAGVERFREQMQGIDEDVTRLGEGFGIPFRVLGETLDFETDRIGIAVADLSGAIRSGGEDAVGGAGRFVRAFGSIDEAVGEFLSNLNLQRAFDFDLSAFLDSLNFGVDENAFAFDRIGIAVGSLNSELRKTEKIKINLLDDEEDETQKINLMAAAVQELNRQRTNALRAEIEGVRSRLDEATQAAEEARAALTAFITGRYVDTAQAQVDNLIGNLGNIGSAIEGALVQGGVRGEAALRSAVGGFESQLAGIIQAGFDDGLRTQEQFRNLLAPLFAAVDEETGDAASRILSTVDFEEGFSPQAAAKLSETLNRVLGGNRLEVGVQGILSAEATQSAVQAQLDSLENQLNVEVVITPAQVQQALINAFNEAGVSLDLLPGIDGAAIAAAQQTGLAGTVTEFANQQTNNVETTIPVEMNIYGQTAPVETAAEVNSKLNAMIAGITITDGRLSSRSLPPSRVKAV